MLLLIPESDSLSSSWASHAPSPLPHSLPATTRSPSTLDIHLSRKITHTRGPQKQQKRYPHSKKERPLNSCVSGCVYVM